MQVDESHAESPRVEKPPENVNQEEARQAFVNAGFVSDGTSSAEITRDHGNHDSPPKVHAEQTIHVNNEHSAKKDPVTTFNKFRTLQEEEEEPLEVQSEPIQDEEAENDKLAHSDTACLSPETQPRPWHP